MHVCVSVYTSSRKSSEEDRGLVKYEEAKSDTVTFPHEEVVHVHCRVCCGFVTEAFIQLLTFLSWKQVKVMIVLNNSTMVPAQHIVLFFPSHSGLLKRNTDDR